MTDTDKAFQGLEKAVDKLTDRMDAADRQGHELIGGLGRVEGAIGVQTALLDAHTLRVRQEIDALFTSRKEHGEKIESIRIDYIRRHEFEQHTTQNREDHEAMTKQLNGIQWKVAMISGGISLGAFLLGLGVKAVFH